MDKLTIAENKLANVCQLCSEEFLKNVIKVPHTDGGHICLACRWELVANQFVKVQPMTGTTGQIFKVNKNRNG